MILRLRTDLAAVLGFFTRIPPGRLMPRAPRIDMAGAVWAFPLAGALIGLCGAAAYALAIALHLPPPLAACWSLGAVLLLTGALHEDGLADMADGFGGGRDAQAKLAIMRDSRIGSYGTLALLLCCLLRIAAIAAIGARLQVCAALVVSGALSRAAIVLVLVLLKPARLEGLASGLHPIPRLPASLALALAVAAPVLLLRPPVALAACAGALLTAFATAVLARRQIGGHSGDVLGACSVLVECVVLSLCAR